MRWTVVLPMVVMVGVAAGAQSARSGRAGRRALLPRATEIALARSAAPEAVSAGARVYVLTDGGFVVADSGTSGVACVVNRSWPESLEPHCYDAEGAATILPMELRRTELRHRGASEAAVEREIADGLASGRFRLPRRPALSYMMSAGQLLYDDDGRRVGAWRPHLMLFIPYVTNAELGLGASPDVRAGMVNDEGKPEANLMILVRDFVPVPAVAR